MEDIDTTPSEGNKGEDAVLNTFDLYLDNIDEATNVPSEKRHREESPLDEELAQIRLPASFSMTPPINSY